jgi:hypothetical protein
VEVRAGRDNVLDLTGVEAVELSFTLSLGEDVPAADDHATMLWIRLGPDDDIARWKNIAHVLDTHIGSELTVDEQGKGRVALLPGRYVVVYFGRAAGWTAAIEIDNRPSQQRDVTLGLME